MIPDRALEHPPLVPGILTPRGEQIVELGIIDSRTVDRPWEGRVIAQICPVHEAGPRPDGTKGGERVREGLAASGLVQPGGGPELLEFHAHADVAEVARDDLHEFV